MFGVGRLGSYISRGVYTVSGPFHPFGGAVDVIVVEQKDGSFKSTPWYVRFGKFQGVLKVTERVVSINVNGVDADFHMYLDHKGEAFFVREVDAVEGDSESFHSSADEMEVSSDKWKTQKSMSCNCDAGRNDMVSELEGSNRKVLARADSSRRGKIFGLPIGRRSMKENDFKDEEAGVAEDNASLERAKIAADLLEVRWTTNLCTGKNQKTNVSDENKVLSSSVSPKGEVTSGISDCLLPVSSNKEADAQQSCSIKPENSTVFALEETYSTADLTSVAGECNGGEDTLWNTSDAHLTDQDGTSRQRSINEVPLDDSSTLEPCKSVNGYLEDISAGTSYLNSLSMVSKKEISVANVTRSPLSSSSLDSIDDLTSDRNIKATPSVDKDEQFLFSDLDKSKVDTVECIQTSSSGSSLGNSEDELLDASDLIESHQMTCKPAQDNPHINNLSLRMNSNSMSSPISISNAHNDAEEEALAPTAESLPIMVLNGDDSSLNAPQTLSRSLDSTLEAVNMVNNHIPVTSGLSKGQQQVVQSQFTTDSPPISEEIKRIISDPAVEVSLCRHLLFEGMGYEVAARVFNAEKLDMGNFLSLGRDILENDKLVVRIGGLYFPWDAALPIASAIGSQVKEEILEPKGMIPVGQVNDQSSEGVIEKPMHSGSGPWKIWPFSFKRSNSTQSRNSSCETSSEGSKEMTENTDAVVHKATKKKIRAKIPATEQLASLNLKEGKNVLTFTFSTAMLGEQKVEARIFLWKWNARIVVSDVDGTITKSDVLGQFMPLMGMDWSQTGVAHLFSAIKENGYQLLFLSARSILQAYHTRQFLINLKQDGKTLPEGPVLISPDGLFPSLYREVIRRAPHEFKIACLEDVKVLFPPDHNPFYAGFGNRDTDELSYLRVGIPRGKIFTINPKGQVVVNRRVDSKSYTSLHVLVHDMFPPTVTHEQEDYNSWNFWRLPPSDALI